MRIKFFDKIAGFDSAEINRFFEQSPDASRRYLALMNERNVHNSVVFLYFLIFSQIIVAYGRIIGDLGFPYYNSFLIVLASILIFLLDLIFFKIISEISR